MRISQDNESWAAGGILRRDFRHTHGDPEVSRHKGLKKKSKRQDPKRAKQIAAHKEDGIQGHLFVWVDEYVRHASWCDATSHWNHKFNWHTGEGCGYDKIGWQAANSISKGFARGECVRISRSICVSCGKIDRVRYTLADDKNDWGY